MLKKTLLLLTVLILIPCISNADTIDVMIKGIDDGVKTNKQQDYNEAVMNAKLQAIERAGVEIKSITQVVNFQAKFDMVESKAKAALLPGFQIMDIGYQTDGTYLVILSGKVKTISEGIESKELRYAKSLVERGEDSKARKIINSIINNSKDSNIVAEAIYYQVLWRLSSGDIEALEKLKAYYPDSKYVSRLETFLDGLEVKIIGKDGSFVAYNNGIVLDTNTDLEWIVSNKRMNHIEAKEWADNLSVSGGGWRMPTTKEIRTIYRKGIGTRNRTPFFKADEWYVWVDRPGGYQGETAEAFSFGWNEIYWIHKNSRKFGFAVRSRK